MNPRPARRWPIWLGLLLLLSLAAAMLGWGAVSAIDPVPLRISVNGERVFEGFDIASLPPEHRVVLAALLACVLVAALIVVPMAVLLCLLAILLALLAVVGLPLLVAAAVLALVLSPLWLLGWLVWAVVS